MLIVLPFGAEPLKNPRVVEFGRNIRRIRKERQLSQEGLAAVAGIDRGYMGHVERGEKNITIVNVFRIADALGVKPGELFEEGSEKSDETPA